MSDSEEDFLCDSDGESSWVDKEDENDEYQPPDLDEVLVPPTKTKKPSAKKKTNVTKRKTKAAKQPAVPAAFKRVLTSAQKLQLLKNQIDEALNTEQQNAAESTRMEKEATSDAIIRSETAQKKNEVNRASACSNIITSANKLSSPLLVESDDLEVRASTAGAPKKNLFAIKREIWVRKTRYYPLNGEMMRNPQDFYCNATSLRCMWCTLEIDDIPIPLPRKYTRSLNTFYVQGQFCSFQCMLARATQLQTQPIARFMMKSVYGISITEKISVAPSPFLMKAFGGPMSPEAYRNSIHNLDIKTREVEHPLLPFSAGIEEMERCKITVHDIGDEAEVHSVTSKANLFRRMTPIQEVKNRRVQMSTFAQMPSLKQQIARSSHKLQLEEKEMLDKNAKRGKKRKTLKDFMKIK